MWSLLKKATNSCSMEAITVACRVGEGPQEFCLRVCSKGDVSLCFNG